MNQRTLGILLACTAAFMWAILAIALKVALKHVDSVTIVFVRLFFSLVVVVSYYLLRRPEIFKQIKLSPKLLIVGGLMLAFNYWGYMKGVELTTPSIAQVVIQCGPVLLALYGIFIFHEKIGPRQILGFIILISGFALFYWDQLAQYEVGPFKLGVILTFLAAVTWSLFALIQKKLTHKIHSQLLNISVYLCGSLIFFPMADIHRLAHVDITVWPLILFLGLNTVIAYGAVGNSFKYIPANEVSAIIICNPLLTILLMHILQLLGVSWVTPERITTQGFVGAFCVILGAFLVIFKKSIKN